MTGACSCPNCEALLDFVRRTHAEVHALTSVARSRCDCQWSDEIVNAVNCLSNFFDNFALALEEPEGPAARRLN
jgi:hypothetical protein